LNKLLILSQDAPKYTPLIEAADLPRLEVSYATDVEDASGLVPDCNIFLAEPGLAGTILEAAGRLEWLQSTWAGVDRLCQPGLRRDYVLTGLKGIFDQPISEYVMTYLFALERQIFAYRSNQADKRWQPRSYRPAGDISLGVAGLGSIGQHVADTARRFGMRVIGLNRSGKPCAEVEKVYTADNLAGFLETLDYLVIILPDTPGTRHFVNEDVLKMMKPSSVLINVGRGSVVNEHDLAQALESGEIGAAVLDVFETEPLPVDSPLWSMPNVYITPHVAAISYPEHVVEVFIKNYQRFLKHKTLLHLIDFEREY
jgi:phosphoglycerate dehydrogenase-like enzyme